MTETAAIVIPIYKTEMEWYEKISLQQAHSLFTRHPIFYMMPEHLVIPFTFPKSEYYEIRFPAKFFEDIHGYNALLLTPQFYQAFRAYKYILIYQLDAFAFSDQLKRFCNMGYDYIGAPWPFHCGHLPGILGQNVFLHVGNGGFSLRNVSACTELLQRNANLVKEWNYTEDAFFAYCGKYHISSFRTAPVDVACQFSWDFYPARYARKTQGILPFGCHAWHRRNADFYVKAFSVAGYDLLPYRNLMESRDLLSKPVHLRAVAGQRLLVRLSTHRPISHYLPPNGHWQVFVVGKENMPLVHKLQDEGTEITGIHYFEMKQVPSLLLALKTCGEGRPLIVQFHDDKLLVELQKYGLECGREYESFWQYYIACADKTLQRISGKL